MPDYIPVFLACRKTGEVVSAHHCAKNCKCFKGFSTAPTEFHVMCGWDEYIFNRTEEDRLDAYEKKLEGHGYRKIGAVTMGARMPLKPMHNPGSDEAVAQGCICPQMDNAFGKGIDHEEGLFWINQKCPIHGVATQKPRRD